MSILASFWKPEACGQTVLPDRSVLIGQKLVENANIEKFKCDILGDVQTLWCRYNLYLTVFTSLGNGRDEEWTQWCGQQEWGENPGTLQTGLHSLENTMPAFLVFSPDVNKKNNMLIVV